ncbi:hypothetical protein [Campylobacter hyointestinalis]|uniref:hypothetical protein n=1 Tax=Campylobacter hyointestinalis TaxID=198 RepID=UPI000CE4FACE|nr:hypothetical protein [Campylobacter hyointestinalis]PPB63118.1 hypothetical protein CDQ72_01600 [Campylobacter hyointestinalis subsp. hyointestinalis]PPB65388.1 hypothetical protein CDQ73_01350 [Campylobacter hyointestinalis subsp. hyointestinalis]
MEKRYLTTKEATVYLGFGAKSNILSVMRMAKNRDKYPNPPEFIALPGGHIRYDIAKLDAWMEANLSK